jgi:hypothetical protein
MYLSSYSEGSSTPKCRSTSSDDDSSAFSPTELLSLAIKKRRSLYEAKERDFRRELLHTGMIQSLCKHLGEGRAKRRRSRRHRSSLKRRLQQQEQWWWSDEGSETGASQSSNISAAGFATCVAPSETLQVVPCNQRHIQTRRDAEGVSALDFESAKRMRLSEEKKGDKPDTELKPREEGIFFICRERIK